MSATDQAAGRATGTARTVVSLLTLATRKNPNRAISLADGTTLPVRPLEPADRGALAAAFERLSDRSRYQRFLGLKPTARSSVWLATPRGPDTMTSPSSPAR